jgi:hypothetical protein
MEHTIIFRGKRLDNGEWVYGGYFKHDTTKPCFSTDDPHTKHFIICDGFCDWHLEPPIEYIEVDPDSVSQWTGLRDKHNEMIFEKDILYGPWNWTYPEKMYFDIFWRDIDAGFWCHCFRAHEVEVVGNHIDHPGLLCHLNDGGALENYVRLTGDD